VWIFFLLLYLPQIARHNELRAQLQSQQQQVRTVEAFALAHPEADKYLSELERRQTMLNKMLPGSPDIGEFVLQVEQAAKETGVLVSQLKPSVPVNKEGYREIPVEILLKGNFFQTAAFLKKLEDGQRFSLVKTLSMQARQSILDCKINITVYAFGISPPPNAPAQPTQGKSNKK
jgi:type IV pilus assembly protein PilO